jgi:rare lipoprotein A (peptidoglycan hydrolase)
MGGGYFSGAGFDYQRASDPWLSHNYMVASLSFYGKAFTFKKADQGLVVNRHNLTCAH